MQNKLRDLMRERKKFENRELVARAKILGAKNYEQRKEVIKILKGGLK